MNGGIRIIPPVCLIISLAELLCGRLRFPGFMQKIYAADAESGFWQGIYQWRSQNYLEAYQKSFIFHMMNKRAVSGSLTSFTFCNTCLTSYLQDQIEVQNQNKKSKRIKS